MRIEKGWPAGPAVVAGAFMAAAALAATVFTGVTMWVLLAVAVTGLLLFSWSAGQLVNHLNHGSPNWGQGAFGAVFALVFVAGAQAVSWTSDPLIWGPVFATAVFALTAVGFHRWAGWVVRERTLTA